MLKSLIQRKLEKYTKQYLETHSNIKLVVVTGSVGKTSTKVAIATVLSEKFKVRVHEGNHNSELSTPLAILGIEYPSNIRSLLQWLRVFRQAKKRIKNPDETEVIVQELGADRIGQIPAFGKYLKPDIAVVTAVSPEHMEYFISMENVAREELEAANFSKSALINRDDIDDEYAKYLTNSNINTYGTSSIAEYHFDSQGYNVDTGNNCLFFAPEWENPESVQIKVLGEHTLRPAVAAGAVAIKLGLTPRQVVSGLSKVHTLPGRMNILRGVESTTIIDDTYNSSPLAAESSLKELYKLSVPQRIAVLGDMNELGLTSQVEHEALGKLCDPNSLAWVVTVGDQAKKYLAPAAKAKGCQVKSFQNALQAGAFVHSVLESGSAILFKGSQGGIYLEEAVKVILHSTDDEVNLVRQSPEWLKRKQDFFARQY
jgi:UDP-N-acetylmuramoyl-tripeptide--D-alanyl-D-alanine ligase